MDITYERLRSDYDELDLPIPGSVVEYNSAEIGDGWWLGKASNNRPVLLGTGISTDPDPGVYLAGLRVRHAVSLELRPGGSVSEFSVVECTSDDPSIVDWFLRLTPDLLDAIGEGWQPYDVNRELHRLSDLFRRVAIGSERDLLGLWAELLLIVDSVDADVLIEGWRSSPTLSKDFTYDGRHIEVKASASDRRVHHFSAEQLRPGGSTIVASFRLTASDRGPSVLDLIEMARERVRRGSWHDRKLVEQSVAGISRRIAEADLTRFDRFAASESRNLVLASDVPQLARPFPEGVSNVQFWSDLEGVAGVPKEVVSRAPLWSAVQT